MKETTVQRLLGTYQIRKGMQDDGITNPSDEIKEFTREFVEKLLKMHPEEEVSFDKKSFLDSKGNIIATVPFKKGINK